MPLSIPATPVLSFRNRIRSGNFSVNQRVVSGTVTLAAGAYGHDGWKAGASGASYTFATAASGDATVTGAGAAANTLLQIIEGGLYLPEGGAYVLTWAGTATARVYQGAASGAPAFSAGVAAMIGGQAVNVLVVTGLTAGTNTSVEFNLANGLTLRLVQLEPGLTPTPFERRDDEVTRAQRYFQKSYDMASAPGSAPGNGAATITLGASSNNCYATFKLNGRMRSGGAVTFYDGTGAAGKVSYYDTAWRGAGAISASSVKESWVFVQTNISGSLIVNLDYVVSAEL